MGNTVLIIDDDEELNALLQEYLSDFGFAVVTATHPEEGLRTVKQSPPDIIILDVMLPDMDGFDVCREIRKSTHIPIIMLTARGEVTDRIVGLELGADDYLAKPFEPRELVARMQSVLRRGEARTKTDRIKAGELLVDLDRQSAWLADKEVDLTTMEFATLVVFMRNPGKVLSRERLLHELRGLEWGSYDRSVDILVSRLRQRLGDDAKHPKFIRTVWAAGYKFIGGDSEG